MSSCYEPPARSNEFGSQESIKKATSLCKVTFLSLVGMTGFEPATSRPPDERATGLRYIPMFLLRGRKGK